MSGRSGDEQPWVPGLPDAQGGAALPGLHIDLQGRAAYLAGRAVPLTAREYLLIELLYSSRGRLFSRDDILERLWGLDFPGDDRIVDTYVKRLRAKLGQDAVQTVRGLGYRCPLAEGSGVAQPHLEKLPPEARLLTLLAGRILQVTDPGHIMVGVYELVREQYGVGGVSLWSLPKRVRLAQAGPKAATELTDGPAQAVVALGTGVVGEEPWALLAFTAQGQPPQSWSSEVRPALDAVAGLVNPALRLNGEITRRQHAESQIRSLNQDLEQRVQARTHDLARANADLRSLYNLAQQLSGAASLHEVWSRGLSGLARLAGAPICGLWRLVTAERVTLPLGTLDQPEAGPQCLAAFSPEGLDQRAPVQRRAPMLAGALRQSLAQVPGPHQELRHQEVRRLTRRAELPGGGQALVIPVAPNLPQVYALHLELPGDLMTPDLGLIDAAARAFGLAFERQMQTLTLEQAALSDELTGLPNRRALLADLTAELSYSLRHGSALTLSLFEIADIQAVNQRLGFAAGNDLIRSLASELTGTLRTEDRVYRLGGAVLTSLVRAGESPSPTLSAAALSARLGEMVAAFERFPPSSWPYGGCLLRVSHVHAPSEASDLSAALHLALARLEQRPAGRTQDGEAS